LTRRHHRPSGLKMKSRRRLFFAAFLLGPALFAAAPARPVIAVDRSFMNTAISPCVDFYGYANGAFDSVPIPGEYSAFGVNQEIDERNYIILKDILETSARTGGVKGSVAQRVGDFYASGMDEEAIERAGLEPLQPWLDAIDAIDRPPELFDMIARMQAGGIPVGFGFGVRVDDKNSSAMIGRFSQGGLGLPERDYYFRPGENAEGIRAAYVAHIEHMLTLSGWKPDDAKTASVAIMALETKLAKASRTLVERRDPEKNYNKFGRESLKQVAAGMDWEAYFTAIGFPAAERTVLIGQPEFFTAFDQLLASESLDTWRAYLRWRLLARAADYLPRAFVEERFAFQGRKLSGATELRPRWKRVLSATDNAIGEDLGQLYVKRAFSPEAKARAMQMVKFHLDAMRARIAVATWMSESTKAQAYRKLDTMRTKVGYPDRWRDYSALTISRQPYVLNVLAAAAFESRRELAKLGKPVDRNEWNMTPPTNNAYYNSSQNEMCFPAGILQPPFFDERADDAANYGALASTIGHELTHGFDDQGRQYDADGNLKSWWTEADIKAFKERADRVAAQYDAFEVLPGVHINGKQTLGENIADVGGLRVSYDAFKLATKNKKLETIDGLTPDQRFFIAFAQGWRTNERPERVRLHVGSDVHSPVRWRVLGPVANFAEFRKAFGCPEPVEAWAPIW
jgi:putative endopeptidase